MGKREHHAGVVSALRDFGVTKQAGFWSGAATTAFGRPLEALKQIRTGTLFKPGEGLYAKGLPNTPEAWAGSLALPLTMATLSAGMSPKENRGEVVGDIAGNIAGSMLGGPLAGIVGQVGGGMLLSNVGRTLGRQFDAARAPADSQVAPME